MSALRFDAAEVTVQLLDAAGNTKGGRVTMLVRDLEFTQTVVCLNSAGVEVTAREAIALAHAGGAVTQRMDIALRAYSTAPFGEQLVGLEPPALRSALVPAAD